MYCAGQMGQLVKNFSDGKLFTWTEAHLHYATLNAAARRGLVEKVGSKYRLLPKAAVFAAIEKIVMSGEGGEYISLKNDGAALGMLCSLKGLDILDCFDKPWDYKPNLTYFNNQTQKWEAIK